MRLLQLRYFIEVYKYESITKASQKLLVSQPSISISVKNLEDELGVTLFNRLNQRVIPTEEGIFFYENISKLLEKLDLLKEKMCNNSTLKGKIIIGVPPMICSYVLPKLISAFKKNYPFITVQIIECGTFKVEQKLLEETIDFGIVVENDTNHKSIVYTPILKTNDYLYTSSNNPICKKETLDINDLKDIPLILFDKGFKINKDISDLFKKEGIEPNIILQTEQVYTVKKFISEGIAAGFLIQDCVDEKDEFIRLPLNVDLSITVSIASKKGRTLYNNSEKFIDFICDYYKITKIK